jgi:hypothetical protein
MPLSTSINVSINASLSEAFALGTRSAPLDYLRAFNFSDAQADKVWSDSRELEPSATENIDLAGVLTDAFGSALSFARVRAFAIYADATNEHSVQVTRPAASGVAIQLVPGSGFAIRPGGLWLLTDPGAGGYVVTPGTADLVNIGNSGAVALVRYDLILVGASA